MMINNDRTVVAADGTRVAYGIHGDGPPVVLVNGLTTSVYYWDHLFPRWSRRFTLITWDFKGHGRSEPARSPEGATSSNVTPFTVAEARAGGRPASVSLPARPPQATSSVAMHATKSETVRENKRMRSASPRARTRRTRRNVTQHPTT